MQEISHTDQIRTDELRCMQATLSFGIDSIQTRSDKHWRLGIKNGWLLLAICGCLDSCTTQTPDSNPAPPYVYPMPLTIPVDTIDGYDMNPFYPMDTVKPVINVEGDTVKTGVYKPIFGRRIPAEEISIPVIIPAGKPRVKKVYQQVMPIFGEAFSTLVIENHLERSSRVENNHQHQLINSKGDTLPTGRALSIRARQIKCNFPAPLRTLPMHVRHDAHYNISVLNIEQELLASNISALLESKDGYLWIGMNNGGLCRYDGQTYFNFTRESGLTNNYISSLLEDRHGHIWIGTNGGGINRFDGNFIYAYTEDNGLSSNQIQCLEEDQDGNIWIGTLGYGVSRLTPGDESHDASIIHLSQADGLGSVNINSILSEANGDIWIGTGGNGAFRFEFSPGGLPGRSFHFNSKSGLPDDRIQHIIQTRTGKIWFGCSTGAAYYERQAESIPGRFTHQTFPFNAGPVHIRRVFEDHKGNIWFGTHGGGLYQLIPRFNSESDVDHMLRFDKREGLPNNEITSLMEDDFGNLWVGTNGSGIGCIKSRSIRHLTHEEGFTDHKVTAVFEDVHGTIWMGTAGDGLYKYAARTSELGGTTLQYTKETGLPTDFITSIHGNGKGELWIGTRDAGVFCFYKEQFIHFPRQPGIADSETKKIFVDSKNRIWIGTHNEGLTCLIYDDAVVKTNPIVIRFTEREGLLDNNIRDICEGADHHLWLATGQGATHLVLGEDGIAGSALHLSMREGLPFPHINTVWEDRRKIIWIGSGSGLVYLTRKSDFIPQALTFIGQPRKNFRNTIRSIREDPDGNIWFSSEGGIQKIISNTSQISPFIPVKFNALDGFKGNTFLLHGSCIDHHRRAWWSQSNGGVELIDLDQFTESRELIPPKLTTLSIHERFPDYRNMPDSLRKRIRFDSVSSFNNYPLEPKLQHTQNNLTFYFIAFNWVTPNKILYSFRMHGLDSEWSQPSSEAKATFRSLAPGSYIFEVCAKGETEQWSSPLVYTFCILPPWWLTWWAFVTYGILGCTLGLKIYRTQLNRKLENAERSRLIEMDLIKTRMYSNITHEFRTPLTLIHGPVSQAIQHKSNLSDLDIQSIYRQSGRLQQLINQMLDLQKLESGKMKVNKDYLDIIQLLRYLFLSFDPWAKEKNISLVLATQLEELCMDLDKEKLTQIMTNLVSNAIKHTQRNGKVVLSIELSRSGERISIRVSDTGEGIRPEDMPYIFDRYYQAPKAAEGGTGIGLALAKSLTELMDGKMTAESIQGVGSTFFMDLPITRIAATTVTSALTGPEIPEPHFHEDDLQPYHPAQPNPSKPVILIIEDHHEVAQFVARCLLPDYQIYISHDGDEGLQMAREHIPDLIISDIMMPGKSGFELTAELKSNILTSHVPVILLTGRGDHEAMMTGIEKGADVYLTKPFEPGELTLRIKKLLELRVSLRAYYRSHFGNAEPPPGKSILSREDEFLKKMRGIVEEHLNNPQFNMGMLSRQMAMSHAQLHRKITALTGESAGKFVRLVRLHKAVELLRNSDMTISEIAYETGFSEPGYFTKIFSKEYHMAPSEYRNSLP